MKLTVVQKYRIVPRDEMRARWKYSPGGDLARAIREKLTRATLVQIAVQPTETQKNGRPIAPTAVWVIVEYYDPVKKNGFGEINDHIIGHRTAYHGLKQGDILQFTATDILHFGEIRVRT